MLRTSFALAAAALLAGAASAQEIQPRRGIISNAASGLVVSTAQYGANIVAGTLESALRRSRDSARSGSRPIPDEVREALIPFYPSELLEGVRYSIGDTT